MSGIYFGPNTFCASGTKLLQPGDWSFTVEQSVNGEAILVSTAKLDSGWHLYSQQIPDKRIATEFSYDSLSSYKLLGDTKEGKPSKVIGELANFLTGKIF